MPSGRLKGSKKGDIKYLLNCIYCKKDFKRHNFRKFCSWKCYIFWRIGKKRPPMTEEQKIKISESKKGTSTWNKGIRGEKSHSWKGGISKIYKTGYYSKEYKIWRMKVFERDNFICQFCRMRGVYLTAHHIKSFAHYPELRFDINNGVTLCEDCHKLTDNYKGRARRKE